MNLLPEVLVKVMATTLAQCVNTPDFLSLSVAETEMRCNRNQTMPALYTSRRWVYTRIRVSDSVTKKESD